MYNIIEVSTTITNLTYLVMFITYLIMFIAKSSILTVFLYNCFSLFFSFCLYLIYS